MRGALRLALSIAATFALLLVITRLESNLSPMTVIILNVALVGFVAGALGRSASLAALGLVVGGTAGLVFNMLIGTQLWNPSPTPSDLMVVRLLLLGAAAAVAAVAGYALRVREAAKELEAEKPVSEAAPSHPPTPAVSPPIIVGEQAKSPTMPASTVEEGAAGGYVELQTRICKFCASVIPAESVFCPMCGNKLVEV
ncbi:MAG: zinc ribbon domain-containing protein [Nitrososphaerota archaeon]